MTKQAQKYDCCIGRIRGIVFCIMGITPVVAADAYNALIINNLQKNLQENLVKTDKKGNEESNGLLLPFSSLMPSKAEKHHPLYHSSYFTHVTSMPSSGERQALFEFEVWSLKFEVTRHFERSGAESRNPFMQNLTQKEQKQQKPPSFRAQRSGVEKSSLEIV